jgi:cytochrome c5
MAKPQDSDPPPGAAELAEQHPRRRPRRKTVATLGIMALGGVLAVGFQATAGTSNAASSHTSISVSTESDPEEDHAEDLVKEGRQTFRFDTFGDQDFWGGTLHLNQAIAGSANGGVGPGVSPKTALAVGLKVDVEALPTSIKDALAAGQVDLNDPKVTLALLKLNSVVGVKGFFDSAGSLKSVGIECALCHSTVDDSFAPGIGKRLDGWANRDLNVGAIVSLSPNLQPVANLLHTNVPTVKRVLGAWGPGKFDAELFLDGKGFRPDGKTAATLIPPAFGLLGVNLHTFEGWGSVPYWTAFVATLEMHGKGTFYDKRLDNAKQFPIAAENRFGHTRAPVDLVSPKLPALHEYQLALAAPKPPKGSFDATSAARGKTLFMGKATCSTCHVPPTFTEPGHNLHRGSEIGIGNFQADRAPTHMYRTTPLKGLWSHQKGGFYHDGRYANLAAVVRHYNNTFKLGLTAAQQQDLVQYLKSL